MSYPHFTIYEVTKTPAASYCQQ